MRLVNDDRKSLFTHVADPLHDQRKLLNGRGDQFFAVLQVRSQLGGALRVREEILHLHKHLEIIVDLLVENPTVGHDDHGIKQIGRTRLVVELDQLETEPGDGMRFPRSRRMLDQIALASLVMPSVRQQPLHHLQLMVTRKK